jgi:hypothetical protein
MAKSTKNRELKNPVWDYELAMADWRRQLRSRIRSGASVMMERLIAAMEGGNFRALSRLRSEGFEIPHLTTVIPLSLEELVALDEDEPRVLPTGAVPVSELLNRS